MARRRERDLAKEAGWREVFARFAASGLAVREFCRREQLVEPTFYAWRRTIAERDRGPSAHAAEAIGAQPAAAFVPIVVAESAAGAGCASSVRAVPSASLGASSTASASTSSIAASSIAASSIAVELPLGCVLRFAGPAACGQLADFVLALQARAGR
jgi:hypothetical protein